MSKVTQLDKSPGSLELVPKGHPSLPKPPCSALALCLVPTIVCAIEIVCVQPTISKKAVCFADMFLVSPPAEEG